MVEDLNESKVKWLTYLVYVLLTAITVISGWNTVRITDMPDRYVRLERYQTDVSRINSKLDNLIERYQTDANRIDAKLDKLIERKVR